MPGKSTVDVFGPGAIRSDRFRRSPIQATLRSTHTKTVRYAGRFTPRDGVQASFDICVTLRVAD